MSATQRLLRFGVFELNLDTEELRKSGIALKLPPQPFKLLAMLAAHAGQMVTREEIQAQLWGDGTHVDFDHGVNKCIKQIRKALGDDADKPVYIETVPRHGYRFLVPVVSKTIAAPEPKVVQSASGEWSSRIRAVVGGAAALPARIAGAAVPEYAIEVAEVQAATAPAKPEARLRVLWRWLVVVVAALITLIGVVIYRRTHKRPVLTEKDTIVVADFDNQTGDAVFDDSLKQALTIDLEQSPFINVLSDARVARTLKLMNRAAGERLTGDLTREVCLRTNSKAMLTGSIAGLDNQYVIAVKAIDCDSGDVLAEAQEQAADKAHVLKVVDKAAVSLRRELGESLSSVQRYATPLEEATTPSLDALKAFSLGEKTRSEKGETAALPLYQRAVDLDPSFARAYAALSTCYNDLNEADQAAKNAKKAYELRTKVSERERLYIESTYYVFTTGDLVKGQQVLELWRQVYPGDAFSYLHLGYICSTLGDWKTALAEAREGMRLDPATGTSYLNVGNDYMALNQLDEAEAVYKEAEKHQLQAEALLPYLYQLAFLKGDKAQMAQFVAAALGKPGTEDQVLIWQASTEAWHGKMKDAQALTLRAMDSARRNDDKETAASYQAAMALYEVEMGYSEAARADAKAAVKLAPNRDVRSMAALALALSGNTGEAEKMAGELAAAFPEDTLVQQYWLPTIRAGVALQHKDANRAIELLKVVAPIELGTPTGVNVYLCPAYLRGQAYLMLHDGSKAAIEFQKFVDHYGIVVNFPWAALARLGLARAYALQATSDASAREKARSAYENFLTLWKDADPDVAVYKQAKTEFAGISSR